MKRCLIALAVVLALAPLESASAYKFTSTYNCPRSRAGATWEDPVSWYLNDEGLSGWDLSLLEQIFEESFQAWSSPCCSNFRSEYGGRTQMGWRTPGARDLLDIEEETWPRELGNALAVTWIQPTRRCSISSATMLFNGVNVSWGPGEEEFDLRSVALHEAGHWLGLSHSLAPDAVMRSWIGPMEVRDQLDPDDVRGVCALYPRECVECETNLDCPNDVACVEGECRRLRCEEGSECGEGRICSAGFYVDLCAEMKCRPTETCERGTCRSMFCEQCAEDEICDWMTRQCVSADPCAYMSCEPGWECMEGTCFDPAACVPACAEGFFCKDASCLPNPETGCSAGTAANGGWLPLLAFGLALGVRRAPLRVKEPRVDSRR